MPTTPSGCGNRRLEAGCIHRPVARRRGAIHRWPCFKAWSIPAMLGNSSASSVSWRGRWPKSAAMAAAIASRCASSAARNRLSCAARCCQSGGLRVREARSMASNTACNSGATGAVKTLGGVVMGASGVCQKRLAMLRMTAVRSRRREVPPSSVATKSSRLRTLAPATSAPKTKPQRVCSMPSR